MIERDTKGRIKMRDLRGQKIGKLTVLEEHGRDPDGKILWLCLCECGNTTVVAGAKMTRQKDFTHTCGCRTGKRKTVTQPIIRRLISQYKTGARRRGLAWDLSEEQAQELFTGDCFYCGRDPQDRQVEEHSGRANGIDRLDSSTGYVKSNCVSCCAECNYLKGARPYQDFIEQIERIYARRSGRVTP